MEVEFLKVEVSRRQYTELYLKVPKGWRPTGPDSKYLAIAAEETLEKWDWEADKDYTDIECESISVCEEKRAQHYFIYEVPGCDAPEIIPEDPNQMKFLL